MYPNINIIVFSESPINGNRNINNTSSPISEKVDIIEDKNTTYQSLFANSLTKNGSRNNGVQPQYSEVHKPTTPPSPTTTVPQLM